MAPVVAQFFLYGDSLKNACVAIIVPDEEYVLKWARENNISGSNSFAGLCSSTELRALVSRQLQEYSSKNNLTSLEKPKEFFLVHKVFTPEDGILTSTFKLKRNVAKEFFKAQISEMYKKVEAAEAARK